MGSNAVEGDASPIYRNPIRHVAIKRPPNDGIFALDRIDGQIRLALDDEFAQLLRTYPKLAAPIERRLSRIPPRIDRMACIERRQRLNPRRRSQNALANFVTKDDASPPFVDDFNRVIFANRRSQWVNYRIRLVMQARALYRFDVMAYNGARPVDFVGESVVRKCRAPCDSGDDNPLFCFIEYVYHQKTRPRSR